MDRHGDAVFSVLLRLVGVRDLAEDMAQETFVRAYSAIRDFRGESQFRTWLIQIAVNLARDRARSESRRPVIISLDQDDPGTLSARDSLVDHAQPDPIRLLEQEEVSSRLEQELLRLPAEYREVFVLKHVEGLSYGAIARITGDTVGSLKVRTHRSRRMLRERFGAAPEAEVENGRDPGAISRR